MSPLVLGLGAGAETRAPMGTCVVGGLITSTLLTLVVVPVMYSLIDDLGAQIRRLVVRPRTEEQPSPADEVPDGEMPEVVIHAASQGREGSA
jgi:HAE1 family hydrophobic/amphiphilic exporter-1